MEEIGRTDTMDTRKEETLFCLDVVVDSLLNLQVPCAEPAFAVRFLDFPTLIVRNKSRPSSRESLGRSVEGNPPAFFKFGTGKSCLFRMSRASLEEELSRTPLYAMLVDLGKQPCALIASAAVAARKAVERLRCEGSDVSWESAWRGRYVLLNLMGYSVGDVTLLCRLSHLGNALGVHSLRLQTALGGGDVDSRVFTRLEKQDMPKAADRLETPARIIDTALVVDDESMSADTAPFTLQTRAGVICEVQRVRGDGVAGIKANGQGVSGEINETDEVVTQRNSAAGRNGELQDYNDDRQLSSLIHDHVEDFQNCRENEAISGETDNSTAAVREDLFLPNTRCPPPLYYQSLKKPAVSAETRYMSARTLQESQSMMKVKRGHVTEEDAVWREIGGKMSNNYPLNYKIQQESSDFQHRPSFPPSSTYPEKTASQILPGSYEAMPDQSMPLLTSLLNELLALQRIASDAGHWQMDQQQPPSGGLLTNGHFHSHSRYQHYAQHRYPCNEQRHWIGDQQICEECHHGDESSQSHLRQRWHLEQQRQVPQATQQEPDEDARSVQLTNLLSQLLAEQKLQEHKQGERKDNSSNAPVSTMHHAGELSDADSSVSSVCHQPPVAISPRSRALLHNSPNSTMAKSSSSSTSERERRRRRSTAKRKRSSLGENMAVKPPIPKQTRLRKSPAEELRIAVARRIYQNVQQPDCNQQKQLLKAEDGHLAASDSSVGRPRILVFLPSQTSETGSGSEAAMSKDAEKKAKKNLSSPTKQGLLAAWPIAPLSDSGLTDITPEEATTARGSHKKAQPAKQMPKADDQPNDDDTETSTRDCFSVSSDGSSSSSKAQKAGEQSLSADSLESLSQGGEKTVDEKDEARDNEESSGNECDEISTEGSVDIQHDEVGEGSCSDETKDGAYTDDFEEDSLASPTAPAVPVNHEETNLSSLVSSHSTSYSVDTADIIVSSDSLPTYDGSLNDDLIN